MVPAFPEVRGQEAHRVRLGEAGRRKTEPCEKQPRMADSLAHCPGPFWYSHPTTTVTCARSRERVHHAGQTAPLGTASQA